MRFLYWLKGTSTAVLMGFTATIVLVVGWFSYGKMKQAEGAQQARTKDKGEDYEHAEAIRNRVDRDLPGRLRSFSDTGYRD